MKHLQDIDSQLYWMSRSLTGDALALVGALRYMLKLAKTPENLRNVLDGVLDFMEKQEPIKQRSSNLSKKRYSGSARKCVICGKIKHRKEMEYQDEYNYNQTILHTYRCRDCQLAPILKVWIAETR